MNAKRSFRVASLCTALACTVWGNFFSSTFVASCRAQGVAITGSHATTRNLDSLYSGSGDRTAFVSSTAVVDVPALLGDGISSTNIARPGASPIPASFEATAASTWAWAAR